MTNSEPDQRAQDTGGRSKIAQFFLTFAAVLTALAAFAPVVALYVEPKVAKIQAEVAAQATQTEAQLQFVEMSLSVLQSASEKEESELRDWARNMINEYAPVEMNRQAAQGLFSLFGSKDRGSQGLTKEPGSSYIPVAEGTIVSSSDLGIEQLKVEFLRQDGNTAARLTASLRGLAEPVRLLITEDRLPGGRQLGNSDLMISVAEYQPDLGMIAVLVRQGNQSQSSATADQDD